MKEKYYGDREIAIVLNGPDFVIDMNDGQDEEGYYNVANGQLRFKKLAELPGADIEDEYSDPDYYLDSWEEASLFDCPKIIVTRKTIYYDDDDVEYFNNDFDTDFETFAECFDFMCEEYSANVIEDYEF